MNAEQCLAKDVDARLAAWLAMVKRVPADAFTPIERIEDMPPQARADSLFWCDSIFRSELNPYNEGVGARHAFHAATDDTPDLLRHEYTAGGLSLLVVEARNFVLIQVDRSCLDILALKSPERIAAIRQVAEVLFNPCGDALMNPGRQQAVQGRAVPVGCPPPGMTPVVEEGVTFSSNPTVDPALLAYWTDRTECGVLGGRVYFLCYKKSSQLAGYENAWQWFDDWRAQRADGG